MNHWIGIYLEDMQPAADTVVAWGVFDDAGHTVSFGQDPLGRVRELTGPQPEPLPVKVFVNGVSVMLTEVNIPSREAAHRRKALPFMVEDQLIGDLRQTHLAVAPVTYGDSVPVAVVSHAQMIAWLEVLHACGLSPEAIIPDQLALPREPGSVFVLLHGDRALVRFGDCRGIGVQLGNLEQMLEMALTQRAMPCSRIEIAVCATAPEDMERADRIAGEIGRLLDRPIRRTNFKEDLLEVLAAAVRSPVPPLNLCQGGYSVDRHGGVAYWRSAWISAAASLLLFLLSCYGAGWYMNQRAVATNDESRALFKRMFPDEHRIMNLRRQAEARLAADGGGSAGPIGGFAALARSIRDPGVAGATLQSLRYQGDGGTVTAEVSAPSIAQINRLQEALGDGGAEVKLLGASEEGGSARGRLELRVQ